MFIVGKLENIDWNKEENKEVYSYNLKMTTISTWYLPL